MSPAGLGSTEGDGEPDELVSGIPEVSPRRQRVGEDRQARRPPDGRDAIPDRQRPVANDDRARTGFTVEAGTPFRERCLDGLTTNWAFPARSGIFEDREFPSRGARDPASGMVYLYSEHYQGQGEPSSHAQAIRARGDWILGVIDPAR